MSVDIDLSERREWLVAASDLERLKLSLAWRDVRHAIAPPPDIGRRARFRPYVVSAIGYALPLVGYRRIGRLAETGQKILRGSPNPGGCGPFGCHRSLHSKTAVGISGGKVPPLQLSAGGHDCTSGNSHGQHAALHEL